MSGKPAGRQRRRSPGARAGRVAGAAAVGRGLRGAAAGIGRATRRPNGPSPRSSDVLEPPVRRRRRADVVEAPRSSRARTRGPSAEPRRRRRAEARSRVEPSSAGPEPVAASWRREPRAEPPASTRSPSVARPRTRSRRRRRARDGLLAAAAAHHRQPADSYRRDRCLLPRPRGRARRRRPPRAARRALPRAGWRVPAVDKLLLLGRLAELDEDPATRDRLCAIATDQLPDEPRLASSAPELA